MGGGIHNNGGSLILVNSAITENFTNSNGGGIANNGTTTLADTTISGNFSVNDGGGIENDAGGMVTVSGSTISSNTAERDGGGIHNRSAGTVGLVNTIIANSLSGNDCSGEIISLGHNLDSDGTCSLDGPGDISNANPLLGRLQDNGGPTFTHALLPGSPAIDAGDDASCPATDQRGVTRPQGAGCDIGAYEYEPAMDVRACLTIAKLVILRPSPVGRPVAIVGKPLGIDVLLVNACEDGFETELALSINEVAVESKTVVIEGLDELQLSFQFIPPAEGNYVVTILDAEGLLWSSARSFRAELLYLVRGTVRLDGMPRPHSGAIVRFIAEHGGNERIDSDPQDGGFVVLLEPGAYDVVVVKDGFLPARTRVLLAGGDVELPEVTLLWGDADGDGVVDVRDLAATGRSQGKAESPWPGGEVVGELMDRIEEAIVAKRAEEGRGVSSDTVSGESQPLDEPTTYGFDEVEVRYAGRFTAHPVDVREDNWLAVLAGGADRPIEVLYGVVRFIMDGQRLSFEEEFIKVIGENGSERFLMNSGSYGYYDGTASLEHADTEFSSHKQVIGSTVVKDFTPPVRLIYLRRALDVEQKLQRVVLAGFVVDDLGDNDFWTWSPSGTDEYEADIATLIQAGDTTAKAAP